MDRRAFESKVWHQGVFGRTGKSNMIRTRHAAATLAATASLVVLPSLAAPLQAEAAPRRSTSTFQERGAATRIALRKVRAPYQWGAAGPRAFDCSGLVTWAYRRAGHALAGRTTWALHERGLRIRRSALRRGDLVYTWDRGLGHVGIFVGRGRYVHAPGAGRRVTVDKLPRGSAFVSAIRP